MQNSFSPLAWLGTVMGLIIALAASGALAESLAGVAQRYPAGSILNVEDAERALADAAIQREAVEQRYVAEQSNCYTKFFATNCMDEARERRRKTLAEIRAVEIQANEFKRKARAAERDRETAQRIAESEAKQAEREKQLQEQQQMRSPEEDGTDKKPDPTEPAASQSSGASMSTRTIRHEAKLRRIQAQEAASAGKRAENVAAYERKQREAEEHLREIEDRKAEKERERSKKSASVPAPALR